MHGHGMHTYVHTHRAGLVVERPNGKHRPARAQGSQAWWWAESQALPVLEMGLCKTASPWDQDLESESGIQI